MPNDSRQLPFELWRPTRDDLARIGACTRSMIRARASSTEADFLQDIRAAALCLQEILDATTRGGEPPPHPPFESSTDIPT